MIASLAHQIIDPGAKSFPLAGPQGPKGDPAQVDYDQIHNFIIEQVAMIPRPKDGNTIQGPPGQSIQGPPGQPGESIQGPAGQNGQDAVGIDGTPGEPGQPGREVEMRSNPANGNLEWRYVGELSWQTLITACEITNTCGSL